MKNEDKLIHKEKLVYDFKDLLSGVGGTLSLLIGYSFLSLYNSIIDTLIHILERFWAKIRIFKT